jgi:hypothetical protein
MLLIILTKNTSSLTFWDCKAYFLGFENLLFGIAKLTYRVQAIPYKMGAKHELCTGLIVQEKQRAFPTVSREGIFIAYILGAAPGLFGPPVEDLPALR